MPKITPHHVWNQAYNKEGVQISGSSNKIVGDLSFILTAYTYDYLMYGINDDGSVISIGEYYSSNGINWSSTGHQKARNIAYYNGEWFASFFEANHFYYSTNGINWSEKTATNWNGGISVATNGSSWLVTTTTGCLKIIPSTGAWSNSYTIGSDGSSRTGFVRWCNGRYYLLLSCSQFGDCSNPVRYSTNDGASWSNLTGLTNGIYRTIAYGNGVYLLGTMNGGILRSTDGANYSLTSLPAIDCMDISFFPELNGFIIMYCYGGVWYSHDGIDFYEDTTTYNHYIMSGKRSTGNNNLYNGNYIISGGNTIVKLLVDKS
jgi:hypothetical protein